MSLTGNKGEWSEIYTLFKILGDTKIFAGDENLNRVEELFYPIIKVLRTEQEANYEYKIDGDLIFISGGEEVLTIPVSKFDSQAKELLQKIKDASGASFSFTEIEEFMSSVYCNKLKADSTDKADIRIVIHDQRTNMSPLLGFSIKSQLGGDSTLLNASKSTNFIYKIINIDLTDKQIEEINSISTSSKIKDRISKIIELGGSLQFDLMENNIFKNNLVLIDSFLPNIIAESLKHFFMSSNSSVTDIVDLLEANNPLYYDVHDSHRFYEYKFKRFLTDVALGMMPTKVWNGTYDANGGYLIVKDDGDILCYHIYNKNEFENYLIANTKFETPSSTRHNFGKIEKKDDKLIFKLNLQIRFRK